MPTLLSEGLAIFFAHPAYVELTEAYEILQTALAEEMAAAAAAAAAQAQNPTESASKKARSKPVVNLQQEIAIIVNKVDAGKLLCKILFFFVNF